MIRWKIYLFAKYWIGFKIVICLSSHQLTIVTRKYNTNLYKWTENTQQKQGSYITETCNSKYYNGFINRQADISRTSFKNGIILK